MKNNLIAIFLLFSALTCFGQNRIQHNGQDLFLNGINLAWINFANDLTAFDETAFKSALDEISATGANCIRWWLHTDGTASPVFTNDSVSGITDNELLALNKGLDYAYERGMGIIMCLWSFDMLRTSNDGEIKRRNRLMLTDSVYLQAYINNALIPMLNQVGDHPAVICWEIFNEPEGMTTVGNWGDVDDVPMTSIQAFVNRTAGTIHREVTGVKVSSGCWSFVAGSDVNGYYNYYTDARLLEQGGDPDGYLDFYMVHYYDWAGIPQSPFHHPASYWELDKPLVIAEFEAGGPYTGIDAQAAYDSLYKNGYAGALSWQWYGDEFGGIDAAEPGISYLATNFPSDIEINYPVIEYNNYPDIIHEIPDTVFSMGSSVSEPYINLKNVFEDEEDSVFLTFSISNNSNPDLVNVSIDVDSNLVLTPSTELTGIAEIQVKATDTGNKFSIEKFYVSVFDPDEPNRALFRKAWSSSNESTTHLPINAIDGSGTTRWSSLYADNQWIAVDMIGEYPIECVEIDWEAAYGLEYEIQVATDTSDWQTVFHETSSNGGTDIALFTPVTCRYIRMYGIDRATQWGFSLYEMGAYEDSIEIVNLDIQHYTDNIILYPVPFEDQFNVKTTQADPITLIQVFNLSGEKISSFEFNAGTREAHIELPELQSGLYCIVIHTDSAIMTRKVMKN